MLPSPAIDKLTNTRSTMRQFSRRDLIGMLGAASLTGLGGCAADDSTLELLRASFFDKKGSAAGYPTTADQIADLPYATLGVQIGDGKPAVMVLAQVQATGLVWASKDRVVFITRGGRLVQTVGLPRDLSREVSIGEDPIAQPPVRWPEGPVTINRLIDLHAPDEFSVPVRSTLQALGQERIEILGRPRSGMHVAEHVEVDTWNWRTTNQFWVDMHEGYVWRAIVSYCPQTPPIKMELLKPAART